MIDFSCNFVKAHYFHHKPRFVKNPLQIFEKKKRMKRNEKPLCYSLQFSRSNSSGSRIDNLGLKDSYYEFQPCLFYTLLGEFI